MWIVAPDEVAQYGQFDLCCSICGDVVQLNHEPAETFVIPLVRNGPKALGAALT
jgi:hypothetical protein